MTPAVLIGEHDEVWGGSIAFALFGLIIISGVSAYSIITANSRSRASVPAVERQPTAPARKVAMERAASRAGFVRLLATDPLYRRSRRA